MENLVIENINSNVLFKQVHYIKIYDKINSTKKGN